MAKPTDQRTGSDRREAQRRDTDTGYTGPERRKHQRRSGIDRRAGERFAAG